MLSAQNYIMDNEACITGGGGHGSKTSLTNNNNNNNSHNNNIVWILFVKSLNL